MLRCGNPDKADRDHDIYTLPPSLPPSHTYIHTHAAAPASRRREMRALDRRKLLPHAMLAADVSKLSLGEGREKGGRGLLCVAFACMCSCMQREGQCMR